MGAGTSLGIMSTFRQEEDPGKEMHANRPLFALEMKTGYQGNSKIWGPKIGFPNRIRNKGEYQEVQLRKNKQKTCFIDYFLQLQQDQAFIQIISLNLTATQLSRWNNFTDDEMRPWET